MSSLAESDSVDLRLWPSRLFHHTYVLINPQRHCTVFLSCCSSILTAVTSYSTQEEANSPVFNFSYGSGLRLRYASKYPNTKEAFGLWFPSQSLFCKTKAWDVSPQELIWKLAGAVNSWISRWIYSDMQELENQQNDLWPPLQESLKSELSFFFWKRTILFSSSAEIVFRHRLQRLHPLTQPPTPSTCPP